jgi:pimeloyl-ACP methyl ester carboxylesterase
MSDQTVVPASSHYVDVGGRPLYAFEAGSGEPLVVFEAGLNDWSRAWQAVQGEVAKFTRTLSYDRAGRGESQWVVPPRTAGDAAADLHKLLERLAGDVPIIVVAHSFGGFIARILAARRPLAGLVLIDAAQEDTTRLTARLHADIELPPRQLGEPEWLTLARSERAMHLDPAFPRNLPSSEGMDYEASRRQVVEAGHLGDTPLVVIAAGRREQLRRYGAEGVVAELDRQWERVWKECQRKLTSPSSESTFIEACESDHYVQRDQPELVVEAVATLVERVRRSPTRDS